MISTALTAFKQRVGLSMQAMKAEHVSVEQARSSLAELAAGTYQEFLNTQARIEALINSNFTTLDEHRAAMQKVVDDLQPAGVDGSRIAMALEGTKELNESNKKMRLDLEAYAIELETQRESAKADSTTQIAAVKSEASEPRSSR